MKKTKLGKVFYSKYTKGKNLLLTCEHASPRIPSSLKKLGLDKDKIKNCKDLYDPGAKKLFDLFREKYKCSYIYSNLSRLVIDKNRHVGAKIKNANNFHSALIKREVLVEKNGKEYFAEIPFNKKLSATYRNYLYHNVCVKYQNRIESIVRKLNKNYSKVFIISIHTMYPKYNNSERRQDVDVIGDSDNTFFNEILSKSKKLNKYKIGFNEPWSFKDSDYGVFYKIIKDPSVNVIQVEIRNDLLKDNKKLADVSDFIDTLIFKLI